MSESGDLLTDDEKLLHKPRWHGETRDLRAAIRSLAKLHHLDDDSGAIDESEDWQEFIDELVTMIQQLREGVK